MSAESTKALKVQDCELFDSANAFVTEAEESTKSDRTTRSITIKYINKEYCALLKLTFDLERNITREDNRLSADHIETLRETEMQVKRFHHTFNSQDAHFDDSIILAHIYLTLANIYYAGTTDITNGKERIYIAKEYLRQCVKLLKGKELDRRAVLTTLQALCVSRNVYIELQEIEEWKQVTRKTLEYYWMYTEKKDNYPHPVYILAVAGIVINRNYEYDLDILYARTLQFLMLYEYYCDEYLPIDNCTMIMCTHKILNKILKAVPLLMKYPEWVTITSQLALLFIKNRRFTEARHHLAAASFVAKKFYEEELMKMDKNKLPTQKAELRNTYNKAVADIAIKWATYGNKLLCLSGERFLHEEGNEVATGNLAMESTKLIFTDLENELQDITALIRDTYITDCKDAKPIFRRVLRWLEEAREFAANTKTANMYVDITRGIFLAYKYLARYEQKKDNQVKLYKQRIDTLYDISKTVNTDDANVRKHVWLQLMLASYSLLDIKTEDLESLDKINEELTAEINKLVKYNIHSSELYLGIYIK
ncbi:protein KBP homolog [Harpegnathos saltator]|uniref:KIF-binding protein n=1 Tax=Harpegnathos saltator TaxID=610380 RepID=E2BX89_HARSA|nr:protein KBP homolog [Harpegnathos saltator]EFN79672.1 Protein KBP-like protein [Harpegnathos saltator]